MSLLDEILELLKDGEWHSVKELLEIVVHRSLSRPEITRTKASPLKILFCIKFLEHYGFVEVDTFNGKVRLWIGVKKFLKAIE